MNFQARPFIIAITALMIMGLALRLYRFAAPGSRADPAAPLAALPPGLDTDESFHALAALRLTHGEVAPFFKIDQGLAAAMIYLAALVIQFTGPVAEAIRIASAIAGACLLIGIFIFARRLLPDRPEAALVATGHVAFMFWFVNFSRLGVEEMTCTALVTLAFAAFWWWLDQSGSVQALAAGGTLALALYSYPAAYLAPVAIALCFFYALTCAAPRWQPRWRDVAIAIIAFAVVAAPLVFFFIQSPEWVLRRSAQVAGTPNVLGTLGGLFWRGDTITRFNIPGRPLLDLAQSTFFLVGIFYCLRHGRQPRFGILIIWLGVMILPSALSASAEHFGRLAGATAAIALIAGVGAIPLWRQLPRWLAIALVGGGLTYSAAQTAYDYFIIWPHSPAYLDTFDFPERIQAEAIAALPGETSTYLTPSDRNRPIFVYLWREEQRAKSFNGRVCTVFPERAERDTVWLVNVLEEARTPATLKTLFPQVRSQILFTDTGTSIIEQLSIPAGEPATLPSDLIGRIGDLAELMIAHTSGPPSPGTILPVRLFWRVVGTTTGDWTVGLYLLDSASNVKAQDDRQPCDNSYLTSAWQPGEIIDEDRALSLPPDLPPGNYTLSIAFYRLTDGERLFTFAADGTQDTLLRITTITIP